MCARRKMTPLERNTMTERSCAQRDTTMPIPARAPCDKEGSARVVRPAGTCHRATLMGRALGREAARTCAPHAPSLDQPKMRWALMTKLDLFPYIAM